jgi:HD superfamily phosphohydrolase
VYDLVSNTVCADLLDYLARDSYFCNLDIAFEYRFLSFLYIGRDSNGYRRIFVRLWKPTRPKPRRDTLTDLVRLLEARYLVAERAYFHHAKIVSGAMLGRALQEAALLNEIAEQDLYRHTDETLLRSLAASANPIASHLARDLLARRLHRLLDPYREDDFVAAQGHDHARNIYDEHIKPLSQDPSRRRQLEDQLAHEIGGQPGDVLLYIPSKEKGMNMKAADMLVLWEGQPKRLREITDPIVSPRLNQIIGAHKALWGVYVIASRTLDDTQLRLLQRGCDVRFMDRTDSHVHQYYEQVVTRALPTLPRNAQHELHAGQFPIALAAAARELQEAAHDPRPFPERLAAIVRSHFARGIPAVRDDKE